MNKKELEKELKEQLDTIKNFSDRCGLPDFIMAVVWSNLLILEELRDKNKRRQPHK